MHCMLFMSYSFRYSTNLPRSSWHAWRCSYEALRHSGWGRVEACHPSERGMEDHEGRVVQLPFGTLFLPSVGVHSQIFRQVICTIPRLTALLKQAWVSHSASIPSRFRDCRRCRGSLMYFSLELKVFELLSQILCILCFLAVQVSMELQRRCASLARWGWLDGQRLCAKLYEAGKHLDLVGPWTDTWGQSGPGLITLGPWLSELKTSND